MGDLTALASANVNVFKDLEKHSSQPRISTELAIVNSLRQQHPEYTLTVTPQSTGLLPFANAGQAQATIDKQTEAPLLWRYFEPASGRAAAEPGQLREKIIFGRYDYQWKGENFIVYDAKYVDDYAVVKNDFVLHKRDGDEIVDGQSKVVDELIAAASQYANDLHDEVYVFDQEEWTKNSDLWKSVQQSTWGDVILDQSLKDVLISDVEGFFDCKNDYKKFGVPWKRGIILHGLPGNGKTISIKALMHSLSARVDPVPTLYVKSLMGCHGPHYSVREIFVKARQMAPCLLVFEDLDSLITDKVKSFFLNEVDGLESNDGIMMIGSTNYLERLDAGISKRPSRFDRKYHFTLPASTERAQYCDYWRSKLIKNKFVDFPPELSKAIADITEGFSFAYLKEAFVASLLVIVAIQRGTSKESEPAKESKEPNGVSKDEDQVSSGVKSNLLYRVLSKNVQTLRHEMEGSRKSAEEAAKNSTPNDFEMTDPRYGGVIDDIAQDARLYAMKEEHFAAEFRLMLLTWY